MNESSKKSLWTGRILTGLTGVFVLTSGLNLMFLRSADLRASFTRFGYSESMIPIIGVAATVASILYLIPRTAVLGAILFTGYMGGAVATHARVSDPAFVVPLLVGILAWLGLYLRDARLRAILPLRS